MDIRPSAFPWLPRDSGDWNGLVADHERPRACSTSFGSHESGSHSLRKGGCKRSRPNRFKRPCRTFTSFRTSPSTAACPLLARDFAQTDRSAPLYAQQTHRTSPDDHAKISRTKGDLASENRRTAKANADDTSRLSAWCAQTRRTRAGCRRDQGLAYWNGYQRSRCHLVRISRPRSSRPPSGRNGKVLAGPTGGNCRRGDRVASNGFQTEVRLDNDET